MMLLERLNPLYHPRENLEHEALSDIRDAKKVLHETIFLLKNEEAICVELDPHHHHIKD